MSFGHHFFIKTHYFRTEIFCNLENKRIHSSNAGRHRYFGCILCGFLVQSNKKDSRGSFSNSDETIIELSTVKRFTKSSPFGE